MKRYDCLKAIAPHFTDELVVTNLGAVRHEWQALRPHHGNYHLQNLGLTSSMALGLALALPHRKVVAFDGDGSLLLNLGSLATIAAEAPRNLAILVLDNERYGETGMQPSHTARGVDLAAIALGAGFQRADTIRTRRELDTWISRAYEERGPELGVVKVSAEPVPIVVPPRDGTLLKHRFRAHALGDTGT